MIHEDYLMTWANNIGLYQKKKYKDVMEQAATKGTYTHNAIEDFIQNGNELDLNTVMSGYRKDVYNAYESFKSWWNNLTSKHYTEVLMQEVTLVCPWFGGTLDLLIKIDGKIYLLDFKTSNYPSYKYFLQLAAYRYMLKNYYGIEIDGCGIIKLDKTCINYEEYIIDKYNCDYEDYNDFMNLCENTFLSLVYSYINKYQVENYYKNLFG